MNLKQFEQGIEMLQNNYNKILTKEQLKLFYDNLKDMDGDLYIKNIKENIKHNEFMPNIAQIRKDKIRQFTNYEQRNYSSIDFDKFYAN